MSVLSLICTVCGKDVKKIGFFGFGKSNGKIFEILSQEKAPLIFSYRGVNNADIPAKIPQARRYYGTHALDSVDEDVIFISPSVRRTESLLKSLEKANCTPLSDAELFFLSDPARVLAITGSDGKSTVTYLTAELTKKTLNATPAGNFGLPLSSLIEKGECSGAVVELSSFQLQYLTPRTSRAIITNITENHLNWHTDFEEYISAKKNIFINTKMKIINLDGEVCRKIARDISPDAVISDSLSALELSRIYKPSAAVTLEGGFIAVNGKPYLNIDDIYLNEAYNIKNFMSAIALSWGLTDNDTVLALAKSFRGLPHRKELIAVRRGISFINSSIDSTPARTERTLSELGMSAVVIVGGASKGLSYEPLIRALSLNARAVVLTGASTDKLYDILSSIPAFEPAVFKEPDFDSAVKLACGIAKSGEAVILSPAHTSYDCFRSFEERGEAFKKTIRNIIN